MRGFTSMLPSIAENFHHTRINIFDDTSVPFTTASNASCEPISYIGTYSNVIWEVSGIYIATPCICIYIYICSIGGCRVTKCNLQCTASGISSERLSIYHDVEEYLSSLSSPSFSSSWSLPRHLFPYYTSQFKFDFLHIMISGTCKSIVA